MAAHSLVAFEVAASTASAAGTWACLQTGYHLTSQVASRIAIATVAPWGAGLGQQALSSPTCHYCSFGYELGDL